MKRRLFVLMTAAVTALAAVPTMQLPAAAEGEETENATSGSCGEALTWEYDAATGTLTIEGSGAMTNYSYSYSSGVGTPWAAYSGDIVRVQLPDGLTSIGSRAFSDFSRLSALTIPETVTNIGYSALSGCKALTSLKLPEGLTSIGGYALSQTGLWSITIPESVTEYGADIFYACENLITVELPETMTVIPNGMFFCCYALSDITIPDSVTEIGPMAFDSCIDLTDIPIPANTKSFGRSAFDDTPWLKARRAEDPLVIVNDILIDGKTCEGNVTVPDSVEAIADEAFVYNGDLTGITLPKGLTRIGSGLFGSCSELASITIPETVTEIAQSAFGNCTALTEITLPASLSVLGNGAFGGCTALTGITFRSPYTKITDNAHTLPEGAVISGYPDSFAQAYAEKYSRKFNVLTGTPKVQYTYELIPLLAPFNEFFFVRTNNPDPYSFRFADPESAYGENAAIKLDETLYADVAYEDPATFRVSGGYIFRSMDTDGGDVILQMDTQTSPPSEVPTYNLTTGEVTITIDRNEIWVDFGQKMTLPALYDNADYLINTYSEGDTFFDKMDAVEAGFVSECLYSGSYIRGMLKRGAKYWCISNSPHVDQTFYIQSPYSRLDNQRLFASAVYPLKYDSIGFPSMLATVAQRLDENASYEWSALSHYQILVTYDGETRVFGGAGHGEGQGIDLKDITKFYTFGDGAEPITMQNTRQLLSEYAALDIPDDLPQDDRLTWPDVIGTVGEGAWIRIVGIGSIYGGYSSCYAYVYNRDGGDKYNASDAGLGGSLYYGGSMGYASDSWVDGRYVDQFERWRSGETFADHPGSSIILNGITIPSVTCRRSYDSSTGTYVYSDVTVTDEAVRTVKFMYDSTADIWTPELSALTGTVSYSVLAALTEQGLLDEQYLDALTLTRDEVLALSVDRNTSVAPDHYFIYDGSDAPGTEVIPSGSGDVDCNGSVTIADAVMLARFLAEDSEVTVSAQGKQNAELDGAQGLTSDDLSALLEKLAGLR